MAKYAPSANANNGLYYYGFAKGADVRVGDVQGREEPDPAGSDGCPAVAQRGEPVHPPGSAAEDLERPTTTSSATSSRCATTTASGRCSASWSTDARAGSEQRGNERIVGAGDGPHVVLSMDFTLTPEQELIRASARELCERELVPHARAWDEAEELPRSLVATLAEAGFLAAGLPEELDGGGLDSVSYCLLCEELGRADSSVRGIVSVSNGLFGKTVAKWGSDEQKQELLPRLATRRGARLLCAHRARLRLRRGCAGDPSRTRRRRVGADGLEGLHHARLVGVDGDRLRANGW